MNATSPWAMTLLLQCSLYEPLIEFESSWILLRFLNAYAIDNPFNAYDDDDSGENWIEQTHFFNGYQLIGLARARMTSLWPFSNNNECVAWNCNRISTRHRPTWCKFVMLCAPLYAQNRDEKKNSCKTYAKLQRTAFLVHWMVGSTWRSRAAIPEIGAFMNYYDTCLDNWCKRSANLFFFSCLFHFEREAPQRLQHQTDHLRHTLSRVDQIYFHVIFVILD